MTPSTLGLDAEQALLVRGYCGLWALIQDGALSEPLDGKVQLHAILVLSAVREKMTALARLRCSQLERRANQAANAAALSEEGT